MTTDTILKARVSDDQFIVNAILHRAYDDTDPYNEFSVVEQASREENEATDATLIANTNGEALYVITRGEGGRGVYKFDSEDEAREFFESEKADLEYDWSLEQADLRGEE